MTFGVVKLSEENRRLLTKFLNIVSFVQLILGISLAGLGLYMLLVLTNHLHKTSKWHSTVLSLYIMAVGLSVMMLTIISIRVIYNFSRKPFLKNITHFHNVWILFNVTTAALVFGFQFAVDDIFKHVVNVISNTFIQGISRYVSDKSWMDTFDYIQMKYQCCGISNYTDWYKTSWISLTDLPQAMVAKFNRVDGQFLIPLTPNSCYKQNRIQNSTCIIDMITKITTNNIKPPTDDLYNEGCLTKLLAIFFAVNSAVSTLAIFITLMLIIIVIGGHYLYTSERNALLMGNPYGVAPGWLFGRGDCGYISGKPLISCEQILNDCVTKSQDLEGEKAIIKIYPPRDSEKEINDKDKKMCLGRIYKSNSLKLRSKTGVNQRDETEKKFNEK